MSREFFYMCPECAVLPTIFTIRRDFRTASRFDVQIMRGHGFGHVEPHDGIDLTGFFEQAAAFADDRAALQSTATRSPEFIEQEPALSIFDK